jgi:preprotein translocase subunit SecD
MVRVSQWRVILVLVVTAIGLWFSLPNFFPEHQRASLPGFMPKNGVSLGLDLRGGSHLLLEVDMEALKKERLDSLADDLRTTLRTKPSVGYTGLAVQGDAVVAKVDPTQVEEAKSRITKELVKPVSDNAMTGGGAAANYVVAATPGGDISIRLSRELIANEQLRAVNQSIEVVRKRIDALGTKETSVQRQGEGRIIVQVPGEGDPERIKNLIGKTAKLTFQMVDESVSPADAASGRIPPISEALPSDNPAEGLVVVKKRALVSGDDLVDAQPSFDQYGESVVSFRFNGRGARLFGQATQVNVGQRFAIVLDGKVLSAPVIREPILGGSGQISGSFTVDSANDLAVLLRAGALPAKLDTIEQRTVGPELGADSIRAGMIATILAGIGVIVFMALVYGLFGVFANVALIANMILLMGIMSVIGGTLTLPGIAGIILTMGMAVDANVLIYERMREEQRGGRTAAMAIEGGFNRALGTILDANITTVLAAAILFQFGAGPVRGFAVTLVIGVLTSVFTSVLISQSLIAWWFRVTKPKTLPI